MFPGDGLQVIYGRNETGKTTLLEFLRGLFFDFPARTPYDFGGQGELAGTATLELRDGRTVELRRRKGNKDKVSIKLDGQPTNLDDAGWLRLLDHADRGLFESVFAFGLDQLSRGEESLKHGSLQSALFGGSLGGTTSPEKIVAELSDQADDLFKKGGSKPAINALMKELQTLSNEVKVRSLRPERYHEAVTEVATAVDRAQGLHDEIDQLRRKHSKIEKQVRAWPKWWDLQQCFGERKGLSVPETVPVDARQRHQDISKELQSLAQEKAKRNHEISQAEQGLAALALDPGAVSHRAEIKSCLELRQSFVEAQEQLPERQRQREDLRLDIDRELAELRPGWSHDDLRAFSIDLPTRTQISNLSDARRERMTSHTKLTAQRDGDAANLAQARSDLAEIGAPRDVAALEAVLADEADFVAARKQLEGTRAEIGKLERKLASQCRKLNPPLSAATPAHHELPMPELPMPELPVPELPVPRAETVSEFQARIAGVREQLRTARASVADDEAQQREIEKSLAAAMSSHAVPSLEERDTARERRNLGWRLVRRKYISEEEADAAITAWLDGGDATSLPDGYEQAVRFADDIADEIYDNANEVAQREELRRQLTVVAVRLDQKRERIADLELQQAESQAQWVALWQPCGFEPLSPDAMLAWLNDHEAACATVAQRDQLTAEMSQLGERIASFEQRLRAAHGKAAHGLAGDDILGLLTAARRSVDEAKDQQRRMSELNATVRRLERHVSNYDEKLQGLAEQESIATAQWQEVLSRLNLPAAWDAELAREVIDKLRATRIRLDSLPGEEARIDAMQSRIREFDERVQTLCELLDRELLRDPRELALEKLAEQMERAVETQRRHDELSQTLIAAREQLQSLNERHQEKDAERAALLALAESATETEFLEVVSRAEKAARLDGQIEQLQREIDLIRAGDEREEFESALERGERAVLEGELRDLAEQLRQQEQLKREADEAVGAARKELAQLDGSGAVAILTEELSRKRSLLAAEVDRYMPLVYARHLLNAAVNRFEKDNQPEMIATVSRLLGQMTEGRYVEFDRTGGGKHHILIRQADGVERTADQLSTGTREQLYLAIRLAYVLHYCERNQPLPIVIDDALVNFDDRRARQTLTALAGIAPSAQVLFFTCHAHMVDLAREVVPELIPVTL